MPWRLVLTLLSATVCCACCCASAFTSRVRNVVIRFTCWFRVSATTVAWAGLWAGALAGAGVGEGVGKGGEHASQVGTQQRTATG